MSGFIYFVDLSKYRHTNTPSRIFKKVLNISRKRTESCQLIVREVTRSISEISTRIIKTIQSIFIREPVTQSMTQRIQFSNISLKNYDISFNTSGIYERSERYSQYP